MIAPLQVIGPPVLDELVAPLTYRIFDLRRSAHQAQRRPTSSEQPDRAARDARHQPRRHRGLGVRRRHVRAAARAARAVRAGGAAVGRRAQLVGTAMSYWRGDASQPARFAQFTSSGFKNVMPAMITAVDRSRRLRPAAGPRQPRHRAHRLGPSRDDMVLLPGQGGLGRPRAARCGRGCATTPVLIPTWGWPDDNDGAAGRPRPTTGRRRAGSTRPLRPTGGGGSTPLLDRAARRRAAGADPAAAELDADQIDARPRRRRDGARRLPGDRRPPPARPRPPAQRPPDPVPRQLRPRAASTSSTAASSTRSTRCTRRSPTPTSRPPSEPKPEPYMVQVALARPARRGAAEPAAHARAIESRRPASRWTPMAEPTLLPELVGEVVDFFEFVGDVLGERRRAGRDPRPRRRPDAAPPARSRSRRRRLDSIKAYRDAADPSAEADAAVLADVVPLLDAVAANIEAWRPRELERRRPPTQFVQSLLDLLATNYVRLRWPRLFLIMQARGDARRARRRTYGAGAEQRRRGSGRRSRRSSSSCSAPAGRSSSSTRRPTRPAEPDCSIHRAVDGICPPRRRGARVACTATSSGRTSPATCSPAGTRPGLDIDSAERPARRRHRLQPDGVVLVRPRRRATFEDDAGDRQAAAAHRSPTSPALLPAEGVFVAFGGHLEREVQVGDRWTFTAKIRSDAGVAALIGDAARACAARSTRPTSRASVGYASRPDEVDRAVVLDPAPDRHPPRHRPARALGVAGRATAPRCAVSITDAALVIDATDNDSFIRKLLGGTPLRLPFNVTVGYASGRGLILEGAVPSASPSRRPGVQNSPLAGDGTASAAAGASPRRSRSAGAIGPVTSTRSRCASRRRPSVPDGDDRRATPSRRTSRSAPSSARCTSASTSSASASCSTPASRRRERNLRFVDARLGDQPAARHRRAGRHRAGVAAAARSSTTRRRAPTSACSRCALGKSVHAQGVRAGRHEEPRRHAGLVVHHHRHARGSRAGRSVRSPSTASACCSPPTARSTRTPCAPRCRPGSSSTCCSRPTRCTTPPRSCARCATFFPALQGSTLSASSSS